jgi:hypothetical protein
LIDDAGQQLALDVLLDAARRRPRPSGRRPGSSSGRRGSSSAGRCRSSATMRVRAARLGLAQVRARRASSTTTAWAPATKGRSSTASAHRAAAKLSLHSPRCGERNGPAAGSWPAKSRQKRLAGMSAGPASALRTCHQSDSAHSWVLSAPRYSGAAWLRSRRSAATARHVEVAAPTRGWWRRARRGTGAGGRHGGLGARRARRRTRRAPRTERARPSSWRPPSPSHRSSFVDLVHRGERGGLGDAAALERGGAEQGVDEAGRRARGRAGSGRRCRRAGGRSRGRARGSGGRAGRARAR